MLPIDAPTWPDPFSKWGDGPRSRSRVPLSLTLLRRTVTAECILGSLLEAAQAWERDPNDRCTLLTLAAALIVSPEAVFVAKMDRLLILPPGGADLDAAFPSTACTDPDLDQRWGAFERSQSVIYLRFRTLRAFLDTSAETPNLDLTSNLHLPNLAVHYSDHEFNVSTVRMLRTHLPDWRDDQARLKLLALGLDALKRQLDPGYPYWEDLPHWLEGTLFYRLEATPESLVQSKNL